MKRPCAIAVVCLGLLAVGVDLAAQSLMVSPRRLVKLFDLEETNDAGVKIGRGIEMPRFWYAVGRNPMAEDPNFLTLPLHRQMADRPGYPPYGQVGYDSDRRASGDYALGLRTRGGHVGAYLAVGALPAVPDSDYLVTAKVRTRGLVHAGAVVVAYYIDADGRRIESSVVRTAPRRNEEKFESIDLKLPGRFRGAAYIGIEVHIAQPVPDPIHPLRDQQVVLHDVDGRAWFDDIAVWQLPTVGITTQSPANLIRAPESPALSVRVRDLSGRRLHVRAAVYDLHRRRVVQDVRPIAPGSPSDWTWRPDLPGYGWYLTELSVHDEPEPPAPGSPGSSDDPTAETPGASRVPVGPSVARTYGAFLYLPPERTPTGDDATRFTLDAQGVPEAQLLRLPEIIETLGLRSVVISAWDRSTTLVDLTQRQDQLDRLLGSAIGLGDKVAVSFWPVPEELEATDGVNSDEPLAVLSAPAQRWMPFVQPTLTRLGQWVRHWQVGDAARPIEVLRPDLAQRLKGMRSAFATWTPEPVFVLPSSTLLPPADAGPGAAYTLAWPNAVTPEHLADHLAGWDRAGGALTLYIEPPSAARVPQPDRVADVALRLIAAWRLDPAVSLAIGPRWTTGADGTATVLPDPVLGVFSNLSRRLNGRRVVGEIDLGPGLRCLVLDDIDGGPAALVAWNQGSPDDRTVIEMYLGETPQVVDVWGNRSGPEVQQGKHRVALERTPVFIENVDGALAKFRAGFGVDERFIPSMQVPHQRAVTLTNPWPMTINGRFTITGPRRWTVNPQRQLFSLAPGASVTLPLAMTFPVSESAGPKRLTARFEFQADREYVVDLSAPMEVGLENVRFESSLRLDRTTKPGQTDVIATCILTNTGTEDLSLNVFASHVGHPYAERLIPRLEPGQAAIRTFRFPNAGVTAHQQPVLCGVRETNGPAVLNKHLTLSDTR